ATVGSMEFRLPRLERKVHYVAGVLARTNPLCDAELGVAVVHRPALLVDLKNVTEDREDHFQV
ncbi:hypothetical protein J7E92_17395, partial [Streptomyces sp. ISL-63]|uniref:hypothetical protein n=2 Tax=unclassified Streptomyces TaxID=2593676 RepID=UPI001BE5B4F7